MSQIVANAQLFSIYIVFRKEEPVSLLYIFWADTHDSVLCVPLFAVYVRLVAVTNVKRQLYMVAQCAQILTLVAKYVRASRAVHTSPQVLTLEASLPQANRAVYRRPLSAADDKRQRAWACRTDRLWYEP